VCQSNGKNMNTRAWLVLLVFVIWGQICWRWYTSEVKGFYLDTAQVVLVQDRKDNKLNEEKKSSTEQETLNTYISFNSHGAVLFFPYKSSDSSFAPQVKSYLKSLSNKAIISNEKVKLIGHTDVKGSVKYNYELGLKRAKSVASELMAQGLKEEQILIFSKGETEPFMNNESSHSEEKNRRVEIELGS
jgi:outer membrane protein OmpA-like peptidoglycan-associated protein